MSEAEKRRKDREELEELMNAIEPAKNENIAKRAIGIADYWLIKAENQAKHIQDLEARNSKQSTIEPKKGKWIYGEDKYGVDGYHCEKCGFFVSWDYVHKFISYIEDYNFCPNCGASMREGGEEC